MLLNTKWIDTIINTGLDEIEISLDGLSFEETILLEEAAILIK